VDGIGSEVDGAAGAEEVVNAYSTLRCEIPDAGVGVGAVILFVVGWATEGRVFVIGPEETSGTLSPEGEVACTGDVPAKDDGGDGGAGEGSAYGVEGAADGWSAGRVGAEGTLEFGCVRLPEGKDFDGVLEVAAEGAVAVGGGENFAGVDAHHEELEVVAVFGDAEASLREDTVLEGEAGGVFVKGSYVAGGDGLCGGDAGDEQESEGPKGQCSGAARVLGQAWLLLAEEGRR